MCWVHYRSARSGAVAANESLDFASPAGNLMFPTIARFGPDGTLYVAQFSICADNGEGQILRIDTNAAP